MCKSFDLGLGLKGRLWLVLVLMITFGSLGRTYKMQLDTLPSSFSGYVYQVVDQHNDGVPDLIMSAYPTVLMTPDKETKSFIKTPLTKGGTDIGCYKRRFGDFDGDSLIDVTLSNGTYLWWSKGNSDCEFDTSLVKLREVIGHNLDMLDPQVNDFNTDGIYEIYSGATYSGGNYGDHRYLGGLPKASRISSGTLRDFTYDGFKDHLKGAYTIATTGTGYMYLRKLNDNLSWDTLPHNGTYSNLDTGVKRFYDIGGVDSGQVPDLLYAKETPQDSLFVRVRTNVHTKMSDNVHNIDLGMFDNNNLINSFIFADLDKDKNSEVVHYQYSRDTKIGIFSVYDLKNYTVNKVSSDTVITDQPLTMGQVLDLDFDGDNDIIIKSTNQSSEYVQYIRNDYYDLTITSDMNKGKLIVDTEYEILWVSDNVDGKIQIDYSVNSGNDWTVIESSYDNTGNYNWMTPTLISSNCIFRISSIINSSVYDTVPFSIVNGTMAVTAPNGAEAYIGATTQEIIWDGQGAIGTVKLEYTTNGTLWNDIASGEANDGVYTWTIPDENSANCKIRVTSELNPEVTDESDAAFTITPTPKISLTAPNGTESWIVGTTQNITWTSVNLQSGVDISYSVDSGATWKSIVTNSPDDGTQAWTIPDEIGTKVMVKVSESGDNIPSDMSDAAFAIAIPTVTMTSPNGGEVWFKGTTHALTWTSVGTVGKVKLEYTTGIGWNPITLSTDNDGSYSWTVPNTESATCKIRISEVSNGAINDVSDADFTITTTPSLTVSSPNGSEAWTEGTTENITWTKAGAVGNVKIEYTIDGTNWKVVADSAENSGTFAWSIPRDPSTTAKVRVTDNTNSSVTDLSDANFTLRVAPKIDITAPVGGEQWEVGSTQQLSWLTEGIVGNVRIEYSADSGATWQLITASTSSSSAYSWKVPNAISTNVFVRVMQTGTLVPADTSTAVIEIFGPSISMTAPNGGEVLNVGGLYTIEWTSKGTVGAVKLEYTTDGANWADIITSTENDGAYNWTVPDYVTTFAKVRVSEIAKPTLVDESDAAFTIDGGTVRIVEEPVSHAVPKGASTAFVVKAMGLAPITYLWQKNGVNIVSAIEPTYEIVNAKESDAAGYRCIVTNAGGSDTSAVATLSVSSTTPTFTSATPQTTAEDTPITLTLAMTDAADADGDPLTLIVGAGANYTVAGTVVTPQLNYHGVITVPLQVTDGVTTTPVVNMTITVTPVNDAPIVKNALGDIVIPVHGELILSCMSDEIFNDVDGDAVSVTVTGLPAGVVFDGTDIVGVPTTIGVNNVTVRGTDPAGLFVEFTFVITVDQGDAIIEVNCDEDLDRGKNLFVTPNPASQEMDRVMIHLPEGVEGAGTILVLDAQGNVLDEQDVTVTSKTRYFWDLCNKYEVKVASGAYYIVLSINGKQYKTLLGVKQ